MHILLYLHNFPFIAPNNLCLHVTPHLSAWNTILISRGIIHLSIRKCHLSSLPGIIFLLYAILWVVEVMLSLLRKAEGERTGGLESLTSQCQLSNAPVGPEWDWGVSKHCYFLLPVDHEALGQAHTNVLNYEAACDECILVHFQRELYHVINRRTTTTKRKMWKLCSRSRCKADVNGTK